MSAAHKTNNLVSESAMIATHDPVYTDHELETSATDVAASVEGSVTSVLQSHEKTPAGNQIAEGDTIVVAPHVPIVAAQRYIADINGLIPTKSTHFNIVVRVITIWKMYETKEKKNVRSVELALIDAQATIPGRMVKDFMKYFKDEGVCRRLSRFDHGLNISGGYRCSRHEYKIMFGSDTLVESAVDLEIPNHVFEYTPFAEITNFVANFDYCFDLIGHIIGFSDPIIENGKKRISVELEDERADTLKVTLWDEHADRVLNCMNNNPEYPVVMIVQYVKCKKYYSKVSATTNLYNGRIYLNDMTIPDIYEYEHRMEQDEIKGASIHKISMLSSISGYTSFEDFVHEAEMLTLSGISELDQACNVVVFGKISGLAKEHDWSYTGCNICNKKVFEIENADKFNSGGGNKKTPLGTGRKTDTGKAIGCDKKWMCSNRGPILAVAPKLDVSNYNIRNSTSEVSVARVTTDAEIIKKYLDVFSDDKEIDPDLSSEFYPNVTPTQYSTAKTAVSCTDETELGLPGDESADSPPPKKSTSAHYGEESVKSHPSKRARKL
ncbi:OLC1v1036491C1 [Oldenlandia corymbosa var. corymbosa]|uniref:OLC1v1036491C1 n=1 Tax=Oldenlandia corymbosa var. corymbosa TaxID=529605 RepID=A0AAV1CY30_OLDCO|nr:OLC1v1036491C1 [Oldenlandia corymbosa var. corymbosa]